MKNIKIISYSLIIIFISMNIYSKYFYIRGASDKEGQTLQFSKIIASSFIRDKKYDYKPEVVSDYKDSTAWCIDGDGFGEWIKLQIPKDQLQYKGKMNVYRFMIKNGITENENLYYANNRVKKINLQFSQGEERVVELLDGKLDYQVCVINIKTEWVKIIILDIYKGRKFNDTCISEIALETWKHPSEMDAQEKKYFGYE
jgi:hypothetical protein